MMEQFEVFVGEIGGDGAEPQVIWRPAFSGPGRETAFEVVSNLLNAGRVVRLQAKPVRD